MNRVEFHDLKLTVTHLVVGILVVASYTSLYSRAVWSQVPGTHPVSYQEFALSHSLGLIFVILPVVMYVSACVLNKPSVLNTNQPAIGGRLPGFGILMFAAAALMAVTGIKTGWTFYPQLLFVVETQMKACLILAVIVVATAVFLSTATDTVTTSHTPKNLTTATLFIGCTLAMFIMPLLLVAMAVLLLDRFTGVSVLDYPIGSPLLYETLFWVFGHPEVYLLILPFVGLFVHVRQLLAGTSSRRNYVGLQGTILRVVFLSFFVFGHHLLTVRFGLFAKVFFIFSSLYIMIPMFDVLRQMFQNRRIDARRRHIIHAALNTLSYTAAAGFFIGGVSSLFFLFPRIAPAVHGTKVVVGHFHGFFVIFLCSFFLVLVWWVAVNSQLPTAATQTCGLFTLLAACSIFFLAVSAAGLMGSLRRVAGVGGAVTLGTSTTNSALIIGSLVVFMFGLYSAAAGRWPSGFMRVQNR